MSARARSKDGTEIAYRRIGQGPALVLVDGALCDSSSGPNTSLAEEMAREHTVYTYDRRGRGDSGDGRRYEVQCEIEDLEAIIEVAGGSACVYGISSGGALALEAAATCEGISKLCLYELPYVVDDSRDPIPADIVDVLERMVAADHRAAAVSYFMRKGVDLPGWMVGSMRLMPGWRRMKKLAHTLPYDLRILGIEATGQGEPLPPERWVGATVPILVIGGGKSPAWMQRAMYALAATLPNAEHKTLEGQMHIVKATALAPLLLEFYADQGRAHGDAAGTTG